MPAHSTLILSDLHLGRPSHAALSAEALRPLWRNCGRVVFNGDVAEVHHPHHRAAGAREAVRLLELCEEDGIEVILLSGNHDPFISDHRHVELAGRQVFVTHGDVMHPAIAPWSPRAARMRETHARAWSALAGESKVDLSARLQISQLASHAEWDELQFQASHSTIKSMLTRPWSVVQVLAYWYLFPSLTARFADEHDIPARFLITGHTHHPGVWKRGERIIINTGSYGFPGRPMAVHLKDNKLKVHRILRTGGTYQLDSKPRRIYELDASDDVPHITALDTREVTERLSAVAMKSAALTMSPNATLLSTLMR